MKNRKKMVAYVHALEIMNKNLKDRIKVLESLDEDQMEFIVTISKKECDDND